jgi:hypothetical protein
MKTCWKLSQKEQRYKGCEQVVSKWQAGSSAKSLMNKGIQEIQADKKGVETGGLEMVLLES